MQALAALWSLDGHNFYLLNYHTPFQDRGNEASIHVLRMFHSNA
jgi:hypothetical protein